MLFAAAVGVTHSLNRFSPVELFGNLCIAASALLTDYPTLLTDYPADSLAAAADRHAPADAYSHLRQIATAALLADFPVMAARARAALPPAIREMILKPIFGDPHASVVSLVTSRPERVVALWKSAKLAATGLFGGQLLIAFRALVWGRNVRKESRPTRVVLVISATVPVLLSALLVHLVTAAQVEAASLQM